MSGHYGQIAFTRAVQDQQTRSGSRRFYARHQARGEHGVGPDPLTEDVRDYLAERDSCYLASVSETGWPYVQHRGGPPGFLKVLDENTVAWAEFRGNYQYVTTGNVSGDDRVALIVMNYPERRRLKIYGHASVRGADEEPELTARLADPRYDGVIERIIVVTVAAFDWNCQQHIRPRFTADEIRQQTDALRDRLAAAEAEILELRRLLAEVT